MRFAGFDLERELRTRWVRWTLLIWAAIALWYLWYRWAPINALSLSDTDDKVRGSMLLGDLYNPALRGGKGDAAKAKSHYDAALDVLVPTRGHVPNASMRGLRSEIMRRKSALGS